MELVIIALLGVSALLFILSFFTKDRYKVVEKQQENISIQFMQEIYQLKKKVKVLEEEYMLEDGSSSPNNSLKENTKVISRDDVLAMYEEGYSIEEIASMSEYNAEDIKDLLEN
ncbi:hypothetical protein [Salipaludibacillus sp. CF4.18]|uniref:hypothetical protein n=1 Tax=Salipaludibacillus sp. CF4.18 TaxID=3373081 RepID=UPI003EE5374A